MGLQTFVLLGLASSTFAAVSCNSSQTMPSYAASTLAFSTPPYDIAADADLTEFRINIPDQDIEDLKAHLNLFKVPDATYENSMDWTLGVPKDWLVEGIDYWQNQVDWYSPCPRLDDASRN